MTPRSDDMNDLEGDIRHLSTLLGIVTSMAIDIVDGSKTQCETTKKEIGTVCDLLWIARDMGEAIAINSEAAHKRVLIEKNALRQEIAGTRGGEA